MLQYVSSVCTAHLYHADHSTPGYNRMAVSGGIDCDALISIISGKVSDIPYVGVQKLIAFVNETCSPRLHWAKAGWPRYLSCFDGSVAYPQTWCDFGCAVQVVPRCQRAHDGVLDVMLLCSSPTSALASCGSEDRRSQLATCRVQKTQTDTRHQERRRKTMSMGSILHTTVRKIPFAGPGPYREVLVSSQRVVVQCCQHIHGR